MSGPHADEPYGSTSEADELLRRGVVNMLDAALAERDALRAENVSLLQQIREADALLDETEAEIADCDAAALRDLIRKASELVAIYAQRDVAFLAAPDDGGELSFLTPEQASLWRSIVDGAE